MRVWLQFLQLELAQADYRGGMTRLFVNVAIAAGLGALAVWPLHSGLAVLVAAAGGAAIPFGGVRSRGAKRQRQVNAALGSALHNWAAVARIQHHPLAVFQVTAKELHSPLREQMTEVLERVAANEPLPDALSAWSTSCPSFWAYQVADLARRALLDGADFASGLEALVRRWEAADDLAAEQRMGLGGYHTVIKLFALGSLAPLAYWLVTRSPMLQVYRTSAPARWLAVWALGWGVASLVIPLVSSVEE